LVDTSGPPSPVKFLSVKFLSTGARTGRFECFGNRFITNSANQKYTFFLGLTASPGGLLFGFDIAIIKLPTKP
jgi:hypothetical protein